MPTLTWTGKEDALRAASLVPFRLLEPHSAVEGGVVSYLKEYRIQIIAKEVFVMALNVIWLILLALIAIISMYIVVPCFVTVINRSSDDPVVKPSQLIRSISIPVLIVATLLISLFSNIRITVMTLSTFVFVECIFGFDSGRSHSSLGERIPSSGSMILFFSALLAAISMGFSFARFLGLGIFLLCLS